MTCIPVALRVSLECVTRECTLTALICSSRFCENSPESIAVSISALPLFLSGLLAQGSSSVIEPPIDFRCPHAVVMNSGVMQSAVVVAFSNEECGNPDWH